MADTKITDLTALATPAAGDILVLVDISDTTMSAAGTNKKITLANLTASLTTATISNSTTINIDPGGGIVSVKNLRAAYTTPTDVVFQVESFGIGSMTVDVFQIRDASAGVNRIVVDKDFELTWRALSSTSAERDLAFVSAGFTVSTDASRAGYLALSTTGYNGDHEAIRFRDAGTFADVVIPIANVRSAADDTAAAALSPAVPVGGLYRTASALKIRVS